MKNFFIYLLISAYIGALSISAPSHAADITGIEPQIEIRKSQLEDIKPAEPKPLVGEPEKPKEKHVYFESGYEHSWVKIRGLSTDWVLVRNRVAYLHKGLQLPYFESDIYRRYGDVDSTFNFGGYYKVKEGVYTNLEVGFGVDADFAYKFKSQAGVEFKIDGPLFGTAEYKFLNYDAGYVHMVSPGAIFYFGNSYLMGKYQLAFTEGRGTAQSGIIRLNSDWNKYFSTFLGTAIGSRLYDTADLEDSVDQKAFTVFAGLIFNITKDCSARISYAYGEEEPEFIINTLDAQISIKF